MAVSLAPAPASPHSFSLTNEIPSSRIDFPSTSAFRGFDSAAAPAGAGGPSPPTVSPASPPGSAAMATLASGSSLKADSKPYTPQKLSTSPGPPLNPSLPRLSPTPGTGAMRDPHSSAESSTSAASSRSLTPNPGTGPSPGPGPGTSRKNSASPSVGSVGLPPSPYTTAAGGRPNGSNGETISRSSSYTTLPSSNTSSVPTSASSSPSIGSSSSSSNKQQAGPATVGGGGLQQQYAYQGQPFPSQQRPAFGQPAQYAFPQAHYANSHQQQQAMDLYMQAYHQQQQHFAQRQMQQPGSNQSNWAESGRRRATSGPAPPPNQFFFDPHSAPPLPYHPSAFIHHSPYGAPTTVGMLPPHAMHAPHPGAGPHFMPPFVPQMSPMQFPPAALQQDGGGGGGGGAYHPYRRGSPRSDAPPSGGGSPREWERERQGSFTNSFAAPPAPFYAQQQGRGSSSSINSAGRARAESQGSLPHSTSAGSGLGLSTSASSRSLSSSPAPVPSPTNSASGAPTTVPHRSRNNSVDSSSSSVAAARFNHQTNSSISSVASSAASGDRRPSSDRSITPVQQAVGSAALKKPSPLSQQAFRPGSAQGSIESGRTTPVAPSSSRKPPPVMQQDDLRQEVMAGEGEDAESLADSDDTASERAVGPGHVRSRPSMSSTIRTESTVQAAIPAAKQKKSTLGSKFKRALSISSTSEIAQPQNLQKPSVASVSSAAADRSRPSLTSTVSTESTSPPRTPPNAAGSSSAAGDLGGRGGSEDPFAGRSEPMRTTPSGRRFGILNSKMNSSTDNISISSTMSSASVMIRKMGNIGKLARRSSLMGLLKKNKEGDDDASTSGALRDTRSEMGVEVSTKKMKKDKKKGLLSSASVAHVTVELDRDFGSVSLSPDDPRFAGMTPAAAMVKRHQLLMEEEEKREKEKAVKAALEAARAAERGEDGSEGAAGASKSKTMLEREKEKLKSRKPRKWGIGFGSTSSNASTSSSTAAAAAAAAGSRGSLDSRPSLDEFGTDDGYEDRTPRQSVEILSDVPKVMPGSASYFDGDAGSVRHQGNEPDPDAVLEEYDIASLRTWGPGGEKRARRLPAHDASPARGILKYARTYNQEDFSPAPRSTFMRERADSYNAPTQQAAPSERANAALVQTIPSEEQVDGLVSSSTEIRKDQSSASESNLETLSHSGSGGIYSNANLNASAPVLSRAGQLNTGPAGDRRPAANGRRCVFAANLSVHTTWPAAVYDRRAEPATCNRLTPALAQRIKEELNAFKMEEMSVHHMSRQYTHFFL